MEWIILSLFSLAIVLLLISFIKKDKVAKLEEELEQITLTHMQDIFQLKKKVTILEEELLIQDEPKHRPASVPYQPLSTTQPINKIIKSQVVALYRQGRSLEQIGKQSTLTKEQIIQVIEEQGLRRSEHE